MLRIHTLKTVPYLVSYKGDIERGYQGVNFDSISHDITLKNNTIYYAAQTKGNLIIIFNSLICIPFGLNSGAVKELFDITYISPGWVDTVVAFNHNNSNVSEIIFAK